MKPAILSLLIFVAFSATCQADSANVSGSYAMSLSSSISFLRLVQRGQSVTGYMQSVMLDPSGSRWQKDDVSGSVSGRNIQLQVGGDTTDGTWGSGKVTLETPVQGYVARLRFTRITVEAWNRMVATFAARAGRNAQVRRLQADYDQQKSQYLAAKDDLPLAKQQVTQTLADQARGQQALKAAQAKYDEANAEFQNALADLKAKVSAGKEIVVRGRQDVANKDRDAVEKDQDEANAAQDAVNAAQNVANAAQTDVNNAEARLSAIRDNQISGLPAADRAVADARARLSRDMSVMTTAAVLAGEDAKKHRSLMPPKPLGRKNR